MQPLQLKPSDDVADVIFLLKESGIPTFVSHGSDGPHLYVCIPGQFEDAQLLLEDPEHVVREPVNVQAFSDTIAQQRMGPFFRIVLPVVAVLVALFAVFLWFALRSAP